MPMPTIQNRPFEPLSHEALALAVRYRTRSFRLDDICKQCRIPRAQYLAILEGRSAFTLPLIAALGSLLKDDLSQLWAAYNVWLYRKQAKEPNRRLTAELPIARPADNNDLRQLAEQVIGQNPGLPPEALSGLLQQACGLTESEARNAIATYRERTTGEYAYVG